MTDGYAIRAIDEKDIDQIALLEQRCFSVPMTEENIRAFLLGENGVAFVCYDTQNTDFPSTLCAYCGAVCVLDEAQILNVATAPDHRGRGLGRCVTEALISTLKDKGTAYVTLEVRESNSVARHLYSSLGFYDVGRIKNYYKAPTEDGIIMKLDIQFDQGGRS